MVVQKMDVSEFMPETGTILSTVIGIVQTEQLLFGDFATTITAATEVVQLVADMAIAPEGVQIRVVGVITSTICL